MPHFFFDRTYVNTPTHMVLQSVPEGLVAALKRVFLKFHPGEKSQAKLVKHSAVALANQVIKLNSNLKWKIECFSDTSSKSLACMRNPASRYSASTFDMIKTLQLPREASQNPEVIAMVKGWALRMGVDSSKRSFRTVSGFWISTHAVPCR